MLRSVFCFAFGRHHHQLSGVFTSSHWNASDPMWFAAAGTAILYLHK
jgi:hypothetical protein